MSSVQRLKEIKDVSRKLYAEDILLLKELEISLLRKNIRINQKELIDVCVKFAATKKEEFLKHLEAGNKDRTAELIQRFLNRPRVDFGKNFLKEIDTTL